MSTIPIRALNRCLPLLLLLASLPVACAAQDANIPYDPDANASVRVLLVQPDGKLLIAGNFTSVGGGSPPHVARLNADGRSDPSFLGTSVDDSISAIAVQSDGHILIGGNFTQVGGSAHHYIARLNADGTLDDTFNASADNVVEALALQAEDKVVVGGFFTTMNAEAHNYIARLNADGGLDTAFDPGLTAGEYNVVLELLPQANDRLLVGGIFNNVGGQVRNNLARINADGTLDGAFNPNVNSTVLALTPQPDGKLLVAGLFDMIGGQVRNNIGRLNADGTLDEAFDPNANFFVYSLALQPDDKIVITGAFSTVGGQPRNRIARLKADGTLDGGFDPNANYDVSDVALQADGKLLIGGGFTTIGNQTRRYIARLNPDGSVDNGSFCPQNFDGATAPALPAGWTASVLLGTAAPWQTSSASADTNPYSVFAADPATVSDNVLISPATFVTTANSTFSFRHSFKTEYSYDGGVLEISVDGGAFVDLVTAGGTFLATGGYTAKIDSMFQSPIANRMAWSGDSGGFITTAVTLPAAAVGHTVAVRWRAASDNSDASVGWYVDSITCGNSVPATAWSLVANYPTPIMDHGVTGIGSSLYSFGGVSAGFRKASSFRFHGNTWAAIASLPLGVESPAVASDDRYAYIIGGSSSSSTTNAGSRYDSVTDTYSSIAPSPTATFGSTAVYVDGYIFKIGGFVDGDGTPSNAVEMYDIAANTWSTVAPYPTALGFVSAFAHNHFVYAAGGVAGGANVALQASLKAYRYDPAGNVWNDDAFADLPQTRWGAAGAAFHAGGLLAGGLVDGSAPANVSASALQWNAQANTWTALPDMLLARARFGGAVLQGCFFAVGGSSPNGGFDGTFQNQEFDCLFYDGFDP